MPKIDDIRETRVYKEVWEEAYEAERERYFQEKLQAIPKLAHCHDCGLVRFRFFSFGRHRKPEKIAEPAARPNGPERPRVSLNVRR